MVGAGIVKVEVEGKRQKVVVTVTVTTGGGGGGGYAQSHRNKILKAVRRGGMRADFWSPQNDLLHAYAAGVAVSFGTTPTATSFNFF